MHYKLAITIATLSILHSHDGGYLNESLDTERSTTINVGSNVEKRNLDKWIAIDKAQHFAYSIFVSLGCQYVIVNKLKNSESSALPVSSGLSFSAGLLKEINDKRGSGGFFSYKDMVANTLGILAAAVIISNP